jgi:hypothetical protein
MKTLRWLIVFVAAAVVAYLLLSRPGARASKVDLHNPASTLVLLSTPAQGWGSLNSLYPGERV